MPRTPGYDALGFVFHVAVDDPGIVDRTARLFHCLDRHDAETPAYDVRVDESSGDNRRYEVRFCEEHVASVTSEVKVAGVLVHDVTARALQVTDGLVLHAGGVEHDGIAIALPGLTEAGKSTLVAGLVRAGMGYLTDEAMAIDRRTLDVEPYPKPLSLDAGSWPLFPELVSRGELPTDGAGGTEWQLSADTIRPDAVGSAAPIACVVFPRYEAGADTHLEQIGRGEALLELAHHTFAFGQHARENLDLLADVVRRAECFRLGTGSLTAAVDLVEGIVGAGDRQRS